MRVLLCALMALCLLPHVFAQTRTCPVQQRQAISNIRWRCPDQPPGTLCFGYPTVSVVSADAASQPPAFTRPGDSLPLESIDWFSSSSEARTWGAARALFPAYPEDSLEAETTALLVFGDVAIFLPPAADFPADLVDLEVAVPRGANLRAQPNTDARIIKTTADREILKGLRRSDDGRWLQVYVDPRRLAWVSETVVRGDLDAVKAGPPPQSVTPIWLPMHRFDFRSGLDDSPCDDAPESGILLGTRAESTPRYFVINGVELRLNGTAFLQAQIGTGMSIYVLDGQARVAAKDASALLKGGFRAIVPLERGADGATMPMAGPGQPEAYAYDRMLRLPIDALLYPARVELDAYTVVERRPVDGSSPLTSLSAEAPCKISAGAFGANMRSRPDPAAPVIAVMRHGESADPSARAIGADDLHWWKLAESIWIRIDATVSGGKCSAVPLISAEA